MSERKCENCDYWSKNIDCSENIGECRILPPQFGAIAFGAHCPYDDAFDGVWPITEAAWWCGEFKHRE